MKNLKKGFIWMVILMAIIIFLAIVGVVYVLSKNSNAFVNNTNVQENKLINKHPVFSTSDTKLLEDTQKVINLRKEGETCGENIGNCEVGLKCAYPCGIQGCQYVCMSKDELSRP